MSRLPGTDAAAPLCGRLGQDRALWHVATYEQEWVALPSFSAFALKCAAVDTWIDWDFRLQYGHLKLIANNSHFLILPDWHRPNLGSNVLALCQRRIDSNWLAHFGQSWPNPGLSSHPRKLQRSRRFSQAGLRSCASIRCAVATIPSSHARRAATLPAHDQELFGLARHALPSQQIHRAVIVNDY